MPTLKKQLVSLAERILGVKILRPHSLEPPALMERFESEHLRKLFNYFQVDCVFDVGANAGQYFERIRAHGFHGPIVSFEPIPELASALGRRAKEDGNLFVEQIALDKGAGPRTFNVMSVSQFSSLHMPNNVASGGGNSIVRTLTVEAQTLDKIFQKWKETLGFKRPFLKLDTQGHDLAVIEGGQGVLPYFIGVQTELSARPIYNGVPTYREVLDFYDAHGFQLSAIVMNADHFPDLFEMDAILLRTK